MVFINPLSPTSLTLASTAFTFYKIHPYIPYSFLWHNAIVPGTFMILKSLKTNDSGEYDEDGLEMYEVISHDENLGIITKILIFDEPQFTFLGTEHIEDHKTTGDPVFL